MKKIHPLVRVNSLDAFVIEVLSRFAHLFDGLDPIDFDEGVLKE